MSGQAALLPPLPVALTANSHSQGRWNWQLVHHPPQPYLKPPWTFTTSSWIVKGCFGGARVWGKLIKCQGLIAKLLAEQQGSGKKTELGKWHSVVETLSCSDSYHSGHHELMRGCLMQVSGPKEHLSVTSAVSVCEGSARPCQSWNGATS